MSEYSDRNVWSDERLLSEYSRKQRTLEAASRLNAWGERENTNKCIAEISAALLARMKPAEAGKMFTISGEDIISVNDVIYYRQHVPVVVTKDFEYIGIPRKNYCWDINFGYIDTILRPVPAREPPTEWQEREYAHRDAVREQETQATELLPCPFCGSKPKLTQDFISENSTRMEYKVSCRNKNCAVECNTYSPDKSEAITIWNTRAPVNLAGCVPWDGEMPEDAIRRVREKADNTEKALEIATKMLKKFADDCGYFSVQCDAEHALAEIEELTGMGTNCTSPTQTAIEKAYVTIASLQLEVAIDHLKRIGAQADVNTKLPNTALLICRSLANQAIAEIDQLAGKEAQNDHP